MRVRRRAVRAVSAATAAAPRSGRPTVSPGNDERNRCAAIWARTSPARSPAVGSTCSRTAWTSVPKDVPPGSAAIGDATSRNSERAAVVRRRRRRFVVLLLDLGFAADRRRHVVGSGGERAVGRASPGRVHRPTEHRQRELVGRIALPVPTHRMAWRGRGDRQAPGDRAGREPGQRRRVARHRHPLGHRRRRDRRRAAAGAAVRIRCSGLGAHQAVTCACARVSAT